MPLPLFAMLSLFLAAAPVPVVAEPEQSPAPPVPRLLVLGDSLSAAYGIASEDGWVSLLQERLRDRGARYDVVNASISGETTAGGLTRLPALLSEHRPQILVIALGANDGLRGFSFDTIRQNLGGMIRLAQESGSRVVLAGVRLPPNYGAAYTVGFQAVFREVARAEGVPLVPVLLAGVAEDRGLMQEDGLHPTAAAQPLILDNVWLGLEPLLTGVQPEAPERARSGVVARVDRLLALDRLHRAATPGRDSANVGNDRSANARMCVNQRQTRVVSTESLDPCSRSPLLAPDSVP